ncbi:MAG TPA: MarR family transcriptional regulator [Anaerolineales bacterium]|nr:MarR family transcriptional regulator [Anaerolineales bacterium]
MLSKPQLAARELLEIVPLAMRTLGSELRHSAQLPTPGHFRLLFMLAEGPHNLSELAEKHSVTPPTMSNTISTLVERGWVQRTQSEQDRRQISISLTPSGRAILDAVQSYAENRITEILAPISDQELDQLITGLAVLRSAFSRKQT